MSSLGNQLRLGFLLFSLLFYALALILGEDEASDAVADAGAGGADSVASIPAPGATASPGENFALANYDLENPARRFKLPKQWREISGLTMLAENRILAHDDERGVVFEIGYGDGSIVKAFALGDGRDPVADDFEGIAAAEGRVYLVSSSGRLYEFDEGGGGGTAPYNMYATGVGRDHEIEGLAYDPERRVLLLVSKNPRNPRQAGKVAIYRWSLDTRQLLEDGPLLIAAAAFSRRIDGKQFQPSGIERHPASGNYFVVAARQHAVAEITPQGQVLAVRELAAGRHPQTEGITFAADNTLVVSDEGVGKRATLTFYRVSMGR